MSKPSILITTTSMIEGAPIQQYKGIISARVVTGTGIFSDIFADFSDFFGGRSHKYQKQLKSIYDEVIQSLTAEAASSHANAIVGFRIDHDEISGKGKQMFMVTATGTAVVIDRSVIGKNEQLPQEVSHERLEAIIQKNRIIEKIRLNPEYMVQHLEFLSSNAIDEVMEDVLRFYLTNEMLESTESLVVQYFSEIEESAKPYLYGMVTQLQRPSKLVRLIVKLKMVDYERFQQLFAHATFENKKMWLRFLTGEKGYYSYEDLHHLEQVKSVIENGFPPKGKRIDDEKWECGCGKVNKTSIEYCKSCSEDIQGFTESQLKPKQVQYLLNERIFGLKQIFNEE